MDGSRPVQSFRAAMAAKGLQGEADLLILTGRDGNAAILEALKALRDLQRIILVALEVCLKL